MSQTTKKRRKIQSEKSQEIVFKKPSLFRKVVSFITAYNMVFLNVAPVFATDISGVTGTNGVYNIEAEKISGSTGFRKYENFKLDNGDVANLQFRKEATSQEYSKFVNMVDSQVNINGIVNTVKGDAFYGGHAIFVSPNGMVVGASGVLNVGSLTVATPGQNSFNAMKTAYDNGNLAAYEQGGEEYNKLLSGSRGNITINGKVMAEKEVELYGKTITVGNEEGERAGIIAGANNLEKRTNSTDAQNAFDSLVSNNITSADSFTLVNGKIKIVADAQSKLGDSGDNLKASVDIKKADIGANEIDVSATAAVERQERIDLAEAKVNIKDTKIKGDTVSVTAKATQKKEISPMSVEADVVFITNTLKNILDGDSPSVTSLWGVAGLADAEVKIEDSTISALKATPGGAENPDLSVYIHAEASSETSENANLLTPTIISFISQEESKIAEFFSSGIYNGFEGAKSSAIVDVKNSTVKASGNDSKNIEISAEASANLDINKKLVGMILPIGLYGVGTKTIAKAIIDATNITADKGDVDIAAISTNENGISMSNESLFSMAIEDAQLWMILNNSIVTDTEATVSGSSVINTKNATVLATNLSNNETELAMKAKANKDGEGKGNSAVSAVAVLNRSSNNITAKVKDSQITTKEDTTVIAQSLNINKNSVDATVDDKGTEHKETIDQAVKDKLGNIQKKYINASLFDHIKGKTDMRPTQNPTLEGGGSLVWNNTNNTTNAIIENSTVTAGDVSVEANTIDLTANGATTDASGEGSFGIGLAVIVNQQTNSTHANIKQSTVKANNVTVNATTELPMNQGQLTFGLVLPFKIAGYEKIQFGGNFASEANGKWDLSMIKPEPKQEEGESNFEITGLAEQNIKDSY